MIPKASINDLVNTSAASAGMKSAKGNAVSDFINMLSKYAQGVKTAANEAAAPIVSDIQSSPISQVLQGKFDQVIPATKRVFEDYNPHIDSKKPLSAQPEAINKMMKINVVGDMADVSSPFPKYKLGATKGVDSETGLPIGGRMKPSITNKAPQYSQIAPEYPKTEANPEAVSAGASKTMPSVNRVQIPDQPTLTTQQIKDFAKSGLDKYQLPSSYGDKRVPLENIDKSVMANVVGGKSPEEVLANLPKAEQKVWGDISGKAAKISKVSVEENVMPHITNQLQKLVDQGYITEAQVKELATAEKLNILQKSADSGLDPNQTVEGSRLIDLQKGANGKAPAFISENAPIKQRINAAVAQGYRDAIGNMSPDIRYSYNQYSSLKRIGEMSSTFRNTAGAPPTFIDQIKKNPLTAGAIALGASGPVIGGIKSAIPIVEKAAGAGLGLASAGINGLANTLGYVPKTEAGDPNNNKPITHDGSIPQDAQGHYSLPQNPSITPLTPGTPEYVRASNALPGGSRQFMVNAPQYMNTINTVQDDLKSGLPLNIMTKFKTSQDIQAYLSDPKNPYAKQLANIGSLNAKFLSAYSAINGTKPSDSQFLSPGDSAEQFQEKYNEMVKYIFDNYTQFQVPYIQTTEAPISSNKGGTVPYQQPQQNNDWSGMKQGGIPSLNLPPQGLPPIGSIPTQ